jgi:hypothetical protein
MNATLNEKTTRTNEELYFPCVAIMLPIENGRVDDSHLKKLTKWIESELLDKYKKDRAKPIIEKLQHALSTINYGTSKKSVAIFVSPINETAIHLDVPLDEVVLIDESFEIRDLVYSLRPADRYLALVQSATSFRIFLGDEYNLLKLKVNIPDNIAAYKNDIAEKIENFTDTTDRKEIMMDKFILHIDKELDRFLNQYNLPVFVLGSERMNGHFKKFTHHEKAVMAYMHGNYDDAKPHQLIDHIKPYFAEIKNAENKELVKKIELAINAGKLSIGIDEVWRNAMEKKGRMLLVERDFTYPHVADENGHIIGDVSGVHPSLVKDAVDVIIEKVLESGGEVKFADADMMKDLGHIALFQYF